ncbi:carbohydrate ABC transporter permease [Bradyrhizobium oligotrophicum]|uniref:carbohydrate ABC transporter permease n=1 Tax=Bradyrhizobium oligotrophicum TaxID=44255 RepID=UPI003EBBFB88
MRAVRLSWPASIARHALLVSTATLVLAPVVWMVSLSLKPPGEIFRASFTLLPEQWYAIENYTRAIAVAPLPRFLANGVLVCSTILLCQIVVCAPIAYALAKLHFWGRSATFGLVLVGLLLPHQVVALPLFVLCWKIGILDSYAALVLPFVVSPFGIFLFRQFFKSISDDLMHAARLDGYSELGIVFHIMLPLARPAVIAFSILSISSHWNDLFWPLIAVRTEELMPPALGVITFRNEEAGSDYGPLMAGAAIIMAPLVIAFLAAQRWFVDGLMLGSMK